jgi:hypothetical protein
MSSAVLSWRFSILCGLAGAFIAGLLTACWYSPLVFSSGTYGRFLSAASTALWPTAHMIGGWVGPWEPATYWLRVVGAIGANALIYVLLGNLAMYGFRRMRGLLKGPSGTSSKSR